MTILNFINGPGRVSLQFFEAEELLSENLQQDDGENDCDKPDSEEPETSLHRLREPLKTLSHAKRIIACHLDSE